ncbi:MAG: porin [Pseudomonadota bacterium]
MTKLKSALLGTAAALMAATGAQAADLTPEPTFDFVRICDAYGDGYYFIPRTETCLRISGYVQWRATYSHDDNVGRGLNDPQGALVLTPTATVDTVGAPDTTPFGGGFSLNQNTQDFEMLGRVRLRADAREETQFGTLRAFTELEANDGGSLNMRFAFIQFAGFTMGQAGIPFGLGIGGGPNYLTISGDNGASRGQMIYYTAAFGNGFAVDVGLLESDNWDTVVVAGNSGLVYGGDDNPDAIARIRVEQSWGSASISGIASSAQGHINGLGEETEFGWAVRGTAKINTNFLGNGGSVGVKATYTAGRSNFAADWAPDFYFDGFNSGGYDLELVETWSIFGTAEVGITPNLKAGIWGGYTTVVDVEDYLIAQGPGSYSTETWWNVGATFTYSIVENLDLGLDVVYEHEEGATWIGFDGDQYNGGDEIFRDDSQDIWRIAIGAQRNF